MSTPSHDEFTHNALPLREALIVAADTARKELLHSADLSSEQHRAIAQVTFRVDGRYSRLGGTAEMGRGIVKLSNRFFALNENWQYFTEIVRHELAHIIEDRPALNPRAELGSRSAEQRALAEKSHGDNFAVACARLGVVANQFHRMTRNPMKSAECDRIQVAPSVLLAEKKNCLPVPGQFCERQWWEALFEQRRLADRNAKIGCWLAIVVVAVLFAVASN